MGKMYPVVTSKHFSDQGTFTPVGAQGGLLGTQP